MEIVSGGVLARPGGVLDQTVSLPCECDPQGGVGDGLDEGHRVGGRGRGVKDGWV